MAFSSPPAKANKASSGNAFFKLLGVVALAVFATAVSVPDAQGPRAGSDPALHDILEVASISYVGSDPIITGSVDNMFRSSSFVGPNRADKTDRGRPAVDLVAMATNFSEMRVHLASLPGDPFDPSAPQSRVSLSGSDLVEDATDGPRISIASIDPALASAALAAINQATPLDPSIPMPSVISDQLAYARANTPATERIINAYSARERWCLATAIYFEARGESYRGQVGVAQVIMNRVDHRLYPNTICGVVFQNQTWRNRCQFSFACDGIPERINEPEPWQQAEEIADQVTGGSLYLAEVANATHYHANYVYPHWAPRMTKVTRIGTHIFYRFRRS